MRLPKLDTIIIGVFFIFIAFWLISKCGNKRSEYLQRSARSEEQEDRPVRRDTVVATPKPQPVTPQPVAPVTPAPVTQTPVQQPAAPVVITSHPVNTPAAAPAPKPSATTGTTAAPAPKYTTLFVTIDGLKMRKEPGLKSATVAKLDLYEQVYFLNKRTDWTQEISLGKEKVTDHWVHIRTKAGKEGWVFGAGVNYYKEKRKGVLE